MPLPRKLSINDARIAGLYDLEHTIGKGHFAVVKLARHVFTGEKVAVKVIDKTKLDKTSQSHMMQEVRCMKLVQHPNIVRLYEVIDTSSKLFLILELGDYDMYDYIMKNEHKGIKEIDAQQYFNQIIKAIDYCHALHVVHRDLKPENVVFFEKLGMVKLTDFGFSNLFEPGQQLQTSCGSLAYSAPEILLGDSYDAPAVDVWSLGVILYMLVCGRLPFQETNESETLTKILDCRFSIPEHVSQSCKQLIARMLVRDPTKRATLAEIVESPWVQAGDRGLSEHLPLIMKDQLPVSAHSTIVDQMVAGNIATEEEILNAIDNDDYTYITATYYLLAERVLACYREEQAIRLLAAKEGGEDLITPTESSDTGGASTSSGGQKARSRSNSWRGTSGRRACTILKEESEEELCSYLRSSSRQSSRFFTKDSFGPPPLRREISQVSSSSRHSFVTSRASSCENFASVPEEEDPTVALVADAVAKLECELEPSETRKSSLFGPFPNVYFDELSPIRELGEHTFNDTVQFQLDSGSDRERPDNLLNLNRRKKMHSSISFEIPDSEPTGSNSNAKSQKPRSEKLPRTPSAPNSVYSSLAKKRFLRNATGPPPLLRRNSSPSVSMFGTSGLHSSRDRISPHAISELLDFSRLSSLRRAASPDSRISSRSPSPNSSGRTSPAVTANFLRLKSTNPPTSSGMRKLSSSPHLLGICEETEETIEPLKIPFHSTPRSISTISQKGPHLSRGNRSASIGLGNVTFSLKPSFTITKEEPSSSSTTTSQTTYSSVRVIRPRQAVVSPDMARRYDQHPRLLSRNRRSTSCSSENSETSDDDVNERKLSLIGSKYCKRNSDDKNNDDDAPKGGGGGGGSGGGGPRRSNSMKEQTIPEEPSNTAEKERAEQQSTNDSKKANKTSLFFLEASPSSSSSFISDSECFSRQLSTPLQPIMEDNYNFNLFNKSAAAEEALFEWLQVSKSCWEDLEEIEEAFKNECSKNEKFNFYRLLRRSKSLESLKASDSTGINYTGTSNMVITVNDEDDEIPLPSTIESQDTATTDSGCSSDAEERQPPFKPKHVNNNFNNTLMKPIITN